MLIACALLSSLAALPQEPPPSPAAPAAARSTAGAAQDHIDMGIAAFKKKRFAAAESHFKEAVEADPQSAAAHFYLGYAIYKTAEPKRPFHPDKERAAAEFARAYELDPAFKPSW